jgi:hypothetical protein
MPEYVVGRPEQKLVLTFKMFTSKGQNRASQVITVKTTVGKMREVYRVFFWSSHWKYAMDSITPYFYFPGSECSATVFRLLEKLGADIKIPKKFKGNLDGYIKTFYDTMLYSSRALILD